jgi:hypothetical protein
MSKSIKVILADTPPIAVKSQTPSLRIAVSFFGLALDYWDWRGWYEAINSENFTRGWA